MINPPKTKEYFHAKYQEKMKELEKHQKDYHWQKNKIGEMQFNIQKLESDVRDKEGYGRSAQSAANNKESKAQGLFKEADNLSQSPDPSVRSRAASLRNEGNRLMDDAKQDKRRADDYINEARNIGYRLNDLKTTKTHEERYMQDLEFYIKRNQKEAEEFRIAREKTQ